MNNQELVNLSLQDNESPENESKRIIKPAIPITISENVRVVLASDRKNLMVQTRVEGGQIKEISGNDEEESGWRTKGYYGTTNWYGVLNKLCAMYKDEKLTKEERVNINTIKQITKEEMSLIQEWSNKIIKTLAVHNV